MRIIVFFSTLITFFLVSCNEGQQKKTQKKTEKKVSVEHAPLLKLIPSEKTGITFNNHIKENFDHFFVLFNYVYNGAGVAVGDINNDGLPDIYFTGNEVPNKLYLNKGDFVFEDITDLANVSGGNGWHNGVVMADVNGDGFQDIYVCRGGWKDTDEERRNLLFINQGDATFKEEASKYGLDDIGYSLMASFFDMDNDNDLDVYVTNRPNKFFMNYKQVLDGKKEQNHLFRDKLFENKNGKFEEIGIASGIKNNFGYGLGVATSDVNDDGNTDILVSNDYLERDYLYMNQGGKKFKEELTQHFNHIPFYAMGIDVVDFNNDGFEDIMQLEMMPEDYKRSKTTMASMNTMLYKDMTSNGFYYQNMHNMLHLNRGKGIFSDVGQYAGVSKTDWSWACLGSDLDNDGYRDLFITNGFKRDIWDKDANAQFKAYMRGSKARTHTKEQKAEYIINLFTENKIPNYIYKNNGDLTFSNKAKEWGANQQSLSNGAAVADLDNDGDLDIIVNNIDQDAFIYKNTSETLQNNYLKIKLLGPANNSTGLGAKITINYEDKIQYHEFKTVRGYLSSVEPIVHFGLGKITKIDSIQVVWNDHKQSVIKDIATNQQIDIDHKNSTDHITGNKKKKDQLLINKSAKAFTSPIVHVENEYDDYKDQILLPHKLSTLGPALAVGDANGDGLQDFFIGGSKDQPSRLMIQKKGNTFVEQKQLSLVNDKAQEDVFASFFDVDNDQDLDLYVVSGGNEFEAENEYYQDRLYINNGKGDFVKSASLPKIVGSGSSVVPLDYDNDGDLDLFIGNRHIPKKYPSPPSSMILENNKGVFTDVTDVVAPGFRNLGMVTSAISSNIDTDADQELLIVGEWMKISVYKWKNGKFSDITDTVGLSKTHGWWNQIEGADIDNDGDMDFVVGNLGLNYKFKASPEKPFYVFANDYDQNGTQDIFLSKEYNNKLVPVRGKDCSTEQLPHLKYKFKSYKDFANAGIYDIIGKNPESAIKFKAETFSSVVLVNNGGKFTLQELPTEAQFSTINGIVIEDLNKDGIKDIVIAGNKFEVEIETTRADASVGLVVLGTKTGAFQTLTYLDSGFFTPYNVKGIKKINISGDRMGVLVAVNDGELQFYELK